jgi:hypothetical protein
MAAPSVRLSLYAATALTVFSIAGPAFAQSTDAQIGRIEQQIKALQSQLTKVRQDLSERDAQVKAAQADAAQARDQAAATQAQVQAAAPALAAAASAAPPMSLGKGSFKLGGVTVTLGGFAAAEGVYRTRNQTADIASNFNTGIPFAQSPNYHTGEFRASARQSRISLLAQGDVNETTRLSAYFETDFLSAGTTSNSTESNSYTLRLRHAYSTYDNSAWGLHILGGQTWSLMTLSKNGMNPRQEMIPLTIDAQYVPGFNWTRQVQFRVSKDFDNQRVWVGASLEAPQTTYYTGPNGLGVTNGTTTLTNPGGSLLNSTANYSNDIAPDLVLKASWDPGFGHYEVFGIGKLMHDRVSVVGDGHNNTVLAGGVGGGAIIPIIPSKLDFQLSGMAGYGIGRYGSAGLPDAVVSQSGAPVPIPEVMGLVGLIGHPVPTLDLYGYVGTEQESKKSFNVAGKGYGYGNSLYSNAGCGIELSSAACTGNTSGIVQGTMGAWWRFLQGNFGTMQAGAQYSYTRRNTFAGAVQTNGSNRAPSTDENMFLVSFRYLPFQ